MSDETVIQSSGQDQKESQAEVARTQELLWRTFARALKMIIKVIDSIYPPQ